MGWLESIFQQWGPYMQFFDRLIPLLAKKPNLPDKIIIVKEGMDKVKDLLKFFTGKIVAIQSKMKVLANGSHFLMLSVIDSDGKVKDLNEWYSSFDRIVNLPQVASIFRDDIDECVFNDLTDTLFRFETELKRFITKGKVITDARSRKSVSELTIVKACEWPTKREVIVWEAVAERKTLPSESS